MVQIDGQNKSWRLHFIVGALVTLALNFILIQKYSYIGSAIATIAAYGTMMIISYQMGQKKYPIPYEMNVILKYLGITILFSAISFYVPMLKNWKIIV